MSDTRVQQDTRHDSTTAREHTDLIISKCPLFDYYMCVSN